MASIGRDPIGELIKVLREDLDSLRLDEGQGLNMLRQFRLFTGDIESNCWRLEHVLEFLRSPPNSIDAVPCVQLGNRDAEVLVPIDVFDLGAGDSNNNQIILRRSTQFGDRGQSGALLGLHVEFVSASRALDGFLRGIDAVLRMRVRQDLPPSTAQMTQGSVVTNPSLHFTVHSLKSNGRVYRSDAYYFRTNNFFGALTTPVSGPILPGLHVFGVQYGRNGTQWDSAIFKVPGNPATLSV